MDFSTLKDVAFFVGLIVSGLASFYAIKIKVSKNCFAIDSEKTRSDKLEQQLKELEEKSESRCDKLGRQLAALEEKGENHYVHRNVFSEYRKGQEDSSSQVKQMLAEMRADFNKRLDRIEQDIRELLTAGS